MTHPPDDDLLGLFRVFRDDGSADPDTDPFLPESTLLNMYRRLLQIRRIDERMLGKQRQGKVGFFGTITGQEATPIATAFATSEDDWIFPALRESAIMLCRGFPLSTWLAQSYGNDADLLKGRQMPSHMSARAVNQVAWSSCIGPQIVQAVGAGLAMKQRGVPNIAVGFMGDGATSEPDFHSAMALASRWSPNAILICQNNHWSISVPTARQTASATIAIKARAYGIPGKRVDGNDVLAVYSAVKEAADRARSGGGASFIECVTYRIGPHSSSDDPSRYREAAEVEAWRKKDPLDRFERYLRAANLLSDSSKESLVQSIEDELSDAIHAVEDRPAPERETIFEDVYAELPEALEEQRRTLLRSPPAPRH